MNIPIKLPSICEPAFNCPHCNALAAQEWFEIYANKTRTPDKLPSFDIGNDLSKVETHQLNKLIENVLMGKVVMHPVSGSGPGLNIVKNLHISSCFNCGGMAIWVHRKLVFPPQRMGVPPNVDLPDDLKLDFEEARSIVNISPRGAAALMRLVVQKLCHHLGEKGRNIDDDIASLVQKGLHPLIQKALDAVRVIGNEAVHPGTMNIKDDPDTAQKLFGLVNSIADQMITHPKTVNELYDKLPPKKLEGIEKRDKKAPGDN